MSSIVLGSLAATASLLPATILAVRRASAPRPSFLYWCSIGIAAAGAMSYTAIRLTGAWDSGLSGALWMTVAACLLFYLPLAAVAENAWRLAPLLLPYLVLVGLFATLWSGPGRQAGLIELPELWLVVHIVVSVATYALGTIAAVSALAVFMQERALKRKKSRALISGLPAVSDAEALQVRLLGAAEIVLGVGILTGMALEYATSGLVLVLDHKTVFSLIAFLVIAALLLTHLRLGLRGRRAARLALVAYLLLTLAYPGVKFVTDVLLG